MMSLSPSAQNHTAVLSPLAFLFLVLALLLVIFNKCFFYRNIVYGIILCFNPYSLFHLNGFKVRILCGRICLGTRNLLLQVQTQWGCLYPHLITFPNSGQPFALHLVSLILFHGGLSW